MLGRLTNRQRIRKRTDIAVPKGARVSITPSYDPEAFGRFSESIARYFGTARFLAIQTVIVAGWIALNAAGIVYRWDPYPFILLNLLFSTQAAYAAPLILLAQNRQDERDRIQVERDRQVAVRTQSDTEFLARELASVRLSLSDMVTADDLKKTLGKIEKSLGRLEKRMDADAKRASTEAKRVGAEAKKARQARRREREEEAPAEEL